MLTQKLTLAEERTYRLFLKSFELQQLRVSTPALIQGSKRAANERAKLGESSATQIVKNRGWMRWKSAIENHVVVNRRNLTTGTHASYNKPVATTRRNNPDATIQSQLSSRKALNNTDANLETQRFNLTRRRRVAPSTGSSNPQLVTQSQHNSSHDWFFNSSTGHSLTSATTARRNTSATTHFSFPPAASYNSSDGSESGSTGLLLLKRFVLYRFWKLWVNSKRIAKEATLCSLLPFEQIFFSVQDRIELGGARSSQSVRDEHGYYVSCCVCFGVVIDYFCCVDCCKLIAFSYTHYHIEARSC
ncbi:hypothetical protein F511_32563 [Dorcoceras hygrometricum]|uniref:Uncharacterized protein n=1 Tax=Dorcoceras hygrometricum TaxID=472368 RepID=A0A2Z7C6D9_9LAMI|nr:hypothetical protein F511_32563 [Dorcoceras hygrometricum]